MARVNAVDCAVVGAGIHGLCTAFWLRRAGTEVVVLEQFGAGHEHGSSHGATRITRSSYHDPAFVKLAAAAHETAWPALEQELGRRLRIATPGVFFGPPAGPFGQYLHATLASGAAVERIDVAATRRRFPLLRIDDDDAVLLDHTAAVVLAGDTMHSLREWLHAHDVELRWHQRVNALEPADGRWRIATASGELHARAVVLAAGAWSPRLASSRPLVVLRQQVGWFDVEAADAECRPGAFPVWARIGVSANDFQYGLPSHGDAGLKAATHRTAGVGENPDAPPPPLDADALLQLARERFAAPVRSLRHAEHCLYTMTADQSLHVEAAPSPPSMVTITACSGHAFKFAPVLGRTAANAVQATLAAP